MKTGICKYRVFFKFIDAFTVAGAPPAARRMRILPMNQPMTFGMKGSN
jgi:hypothetical protein